MSSLRNQLENAVTALDIDKFKALAEEADPSDLNYIMNDVLYEAFSGGYYNRPNEVRAYFYFDDSSSDDEDDSSSSDESSSDDEDDVRQSFNLLKACLNKGSNPNSLDENGYRLIDYVIVCAFKHYTCFIRILVAAGAKLNVTIKHPLRPTLLMVAAMDLDVDLVEFLLEQGAKKNLTDRNGRNAKDHALRAISQESDKGDKSKWTTKELEDIQFKMLQLLEPRESESSESSSYSEYDEEESEYDEEESEYDSSSSSEDSGRRPRLMINRGN